MLRAALISKSTHCALCRRAFTQRDYVTRGAIYIDHVVPITAGGPMYDTRNLQVVCAKCNLEKGDRQHHHQQQHTPDEAEEPPLIWVA